MSLKNFQKLIEWSSSQYHYLPWRTKRTLYRTLVSEIMLQQTTVSTVLNHFESFIKKYPDLMSLAKASEEEVCIAWKGLGYYRRARNLRNLAIQMVELHNGEVPVDKDRLLKLKGIGPYTANAILSIGADKTALALDANLERVLSRFYAYEEEKGPKLQQKLWADFEQQKIAQEMKELGPRALNEALMDLGRIICQAKKASCSLCPLQSSCCAYKADEVLHFPRTTEKKKGNDFYLKLLRIVVKDKNKFLFYQKSESEWLSGQWELPTFVLETNDEKFSQYPKLRSKKEYEKGTSFKTGITKYSIENIVVKMELEEFERISKNVHREYEFKTHNERLNLSTTSIKALRKI